MMDSVLDENKILRASDNGHGMPSGGNGNYNLTVVMEAVFGFLMRGAKRLLELNPRETEILKRLAVAFMSASESERPEILETMLEVAWPADHIGGLGGGDKPSSDVRQRVRVARAFIGKQIKECRENIGMTQTEFAKKARIPQSHVSRLENGKLAPTRRTIDRLSKVLRVKPSRLDPGIPDTTEY